MIEEVTTLSRFSAMRHHLGITAALAGQLLVEPEYYGIKVNEQAMLVEPVNDDPYVVLLAQNADGSTDFDRCTKHCFKAQPGSGTDFLRARISAGIFFEGFNERQRCAENFGIHLRQKSADQERQFGVRSDK